MPNKKRYERSYVMKKALLIILTLALSASMAFAASVNGIVTDAVTGEPIEGATVIFTFQDSLNLLLGHGGGHHGGGHHGGGHHGNCSIVTTTDAQGVYELSDVAEGIYDARARKQGEYSSDSITDIEINAATVTVDFELEPCSGPPGFRMF